MSLAFSLWELGEEDDRLAERDVNSKRSNRELSIVGFKRIDIVAYGHLLNNITARPVWEKKKSKRITNLHKDHLSHSPEPIIRQLRE